ncbi:MAG: hypothetical protein F6K19_47400, partial [Cyanothece sp. SIO1E1]|nr:hypothetical protein [Cyanothece sp. SIO1E1]
MTLFADAKKASSSVQKQANVENLPFEPLAVDDVRTSAYLNSLAQMSFFGLGSLASTLVVGMSLSEGLDTKPAAAQEQALPLQPSADADYATANKAQITLSATPTPPEIIAVPAVPIPSAQPLEPLVDKILTQPSPALEQALAEAESLVEPIFNQAISSPESFTSTNSPSQPKPLAPPVAALPVLPAASAIPPSRSIPSTSPALPLAQFVAIAAPSSGAGDTDAPAPPVNKAAAQVTPLPVGKSMVPPKAQQPDQSAVNASIAPQPQ